MYCSERFSVRSIINLPAMPFKGMRDRCALASNVIFSKCNCVFYDNMYRKSIFRSLFWLLLGMLSQRLAGNNMQTDVFGPPGTNMMGNAHVMNRAQVPPGINAGMVPALGQSVNVGHAQEKLQNALKSREMQVRAICVLSFF